MSAVTTDILDILVENHGSIIILLRAASPVGKAWIGGVRQPGRVLALPSPPAPGSWSPITSARSSRAPHDDALRRLRSKSKGEGQVRWMNATLL